MGVHVCACVSKYWMDEGDSIVNSTCNPGHDGPLPPGEESDNVIHTHAHTHIQLACDKCFEEKDAGPRGRIIGGWMINWLVGLDLRR